MKTKTLNDRVAVCSWSLQPANPEELVAKLLATGIRRVQLALDPLREAPEVWGQTAALFQQHGISLISGMFGCAGENYTTLETIRLTGGIAPDATWEQNWKNIEATAAVARQLGLKLITFHAGFLPHLESDPGFGKLSARLAQVADLFLAQGMVLGLETGQETAVVLLQLLQRLNRPNLGVNFDPANMILYDKGDPIEAMRVLGPWIRQVHLKDARHTKAPGTWGEEVSVGSGEVDWRAFFATLKQLNFAGDFVIEREAGAQRVADIRQAREAVTKIFQSATSGSAGGLK